MEDMRSRSYGDGRMQMELYNGGGGGGGGGGRGVMPPYPGQGMHDMRCYSTSYAYTQTSIQSYQPPRELKFKKEKSIPGSSSSSSAPASAKGGSFWSFSDPELQRRKRVAGYKVYAMEGRMKGSLRRSFRWLKDRYTQVVYGWW